MDEKDFGCLAIAGDRGRRSFSNYGGRLVPFGGNRPKPLVVGVTYPTSATCAGPYSRETGNEIINNMALQHTSRITNGDLISNLLQYSVK